MKHRHATQTTQLFPDLRLLLAYCVERDTSLRSAKVALVVGSILALINHGHTSSTTGVPLVQSIKKEE